MRRLRIFEHISLDGVIQASADENNFPYSDWSGPYRTPAGRDMLLARYCEKFDLLLGRRTYDGFSSFWPKRCQFLHACWAFEEPVTKNQ